MTIPIYDATEKMAAPYFPRVTHERVMEPLRLPAMQLPPPVWYYAPMPTQESQKRPQKGKEALFWAGLAILIIWSTALAIVAILEFTR